jgi:hypothetical protein
MVETSGGRRSRTGQSRWRSPFRLAAPALLLLMMPGLARAQPAPSPSDDVATGATNASTPGGKQPRCDATCIKANLNKAASACARLIEAQAPIDFDWLTRPFTGLFQQGDQSSPDDSVVRYRGDSIRFMTPQKEWIRVSYECSYDAAAQKAITVLVRPGRLDRQEPAATAAVSAQRKGTGAQMAPPSNAPRVPSRSTVYVDEPSDIEFSQIEPRHKRP